MKDYTQLLLSLKEARRVLNGCGAEPVERSLADFQYQMDVEECLRILNELHKQSCTEIIEGVRQL